MLSIAEQLGQPGGAAQMGFSKQGGRVGLSRCIVVPTLVGRERVGVLARPGQRPPQTPAHPPSLCPPDPCPPSPRAHLQVAWSSQGGNSFLGAQMAQPADCSGLTQDMIDAEVKVRPRDGLHGAHGLRL